MITKTVSPQKTIKMMLFLAGWGSYINICTEAHLLSAQGLLIISSHISTILVKIIIVVVVIIVINYETVEDCGPAPPLGR